MKSDAGSAKARLTMLNKGFPSGEAGSAKPRLKRGSWGRFFLRDFGEFVYSSFTASIDAVRIRRRLYRIPVYTVPLSSRPAAVPPSPVGKAFLLAFNCKIPALRTVVLGIWTDGRRKKKQIFEKLKEKKESLQSVRKISTNVLARRLNKKEKAEILHEKFTKRQREQNVCAPAMEKRRL